MRREEIQDFPEREIGYETQVPDSPSGYGRIAGNRNQRIIEMQQRLFVHVPTAFPHAFLLLAVPAYALNRSRWRQ
jgi:hypothetical protein